MSKEPLDIFGRVQAAYEEAYDKIQADYFEIQRLGFDSVKYSIPWNKSPASKLSSYDCYHLSKALFQSQA